MNAIDRNEDSYRRAREAAVSLVEHICEHLNVCSPGIRLAEVLDGFATYCFVTDRSGALAYSSPGLAALDPDAVQSDSGAEQSASAELSRRTNQLVLEEGRTLSYVHQVCAAEGQVRCLQTQKIPLIGPDDAVAGIFGVSREISLAEFEAGRGGHGPFGIAPTVNVSRMRQQLDLLEDRERELAQLVSRGAINKQLASHFDVSIRSVENWRRSLLAKLKIDSIPELTRWIARLEDFGLLPQA